MSAKEKLRVPITYEAIKKEAERVAKETKSSLPPLPSEGELALFLAQIWAKDWHLIKAVQDHLNRVGVRTPAREGHLLWVAKLAAWGAEKNVRKEELLVL